MTICASCGQPTDTEITPEDEEDGVQPFCDDCIGAVVDLLGEPTDSEKAPA